MMTWHEFGGKFPAYLSLPLIEQVPSSDIVWGEQTNFMAVLGWNHNASGSVPVPLSKPLAAGTETKVD
jgi:hypothetical protein